MKKLLILTLVLGMAALANAELIFNVNDEPQPDEITICPSDMIELGLELAEGQDILKWAFEYRLLNEQAELILDGTVFPWQSMFPGKIASSDGEGIVSWAVMGADNFMTAADGPLVLMEGLMVHCLEPTDVVLEIRVASDTVIDGEPIPIGTLLHTLTIHQIPEPATMLLLGLGGLFLRRRK